MDLHKYVFYIYTTYYAFLGAAAAKIDDNQNILACALVLGVTTSHFILAIILFYTGFEKFAWTKEAWANNRAIKRRYGNTSIRGIALTADICTTIAFVLSIVYLDHKHHSTGIAIAAVTLAFIGNTGCISVHASQRNTAVANTQIPLI